MTLRDRAEIALYELYNVADHVDRGAQVARHDIKYSPSQALAALLNVRESAARIEIHIDDAIKALEALIAEPDRPDHPGCPR